MRSPLWQKALPLFAFSFVEIAVSFVRALILTHFLGPYEFGFASAISLTYATSVLVTDLATYRFVLSSRPDELRKALAGAHALIVVRGLFVAFSLLIASYPLSCAFATCDDWQSFAWLAPIAFIAAFEHLEIRIAERDYRYWPQLAASFAAHSLSLIILVLVAYQTKSHNAFLPYLLVQVIVYVLVSHLLASNPYQAKLKSPYFRKAFLFGFPLLLNGVGLAIIGQGDRFMVGSFLGLEALGVYTILFLAGILPISALLRILNPIFFAGLHNARGENYTSRLRLFGRATPMIAGCYALGLIALLKAVLPLVFGARYTISDPIVFLLALIAFVRIVRIEPGNSLLLHTHNTGKLATVNMSLAIGLFAAAALAFVYRSIEAVLIGGLIGEFAGLCLMIFMTRNLLKAAISDYLCSLLTILALVVTASFLVLSTPIDDSLLYRVGIAGIFFALILLGATLFLPGPYRRAYGADASPVSALKLSASEVADVNAQLPKTVD